MKVTVNRYSKDQYYIFFYRDGGSLYFNQQHEKFLDLESFEYINDVLCTSDEVGELIEKYDFILSEWSCDISLVTKEFKLGGAL